MKHLVIQSAQFRSLEKGFSEWLDTLGYSSNIIRYLPTFVREFLHYLETQQITKIKSATSAHVEEFYKQLSNRKNERRGGSISQAHLNKYLYGLRLFSTYLQRTQSISLVISIENKKIHRELKNILTLEEVMLLLEAADKNAIGYRDQAMIAIYYGCGLRLSEGVALKVRDVDINKRMILIRNSKNSRQRNVPISSSIIGYITNYLIHGRPYLVRRGNEYFFISERGDGVQAQALYIRLKQLQERTQNTTLMRKKIGIHTLRHSIATHLLKNKVPIEAIGKFLGHQSIDSTQVYLHVANEGV